MGVKKRKFNPRPVIEYPPVPQKKWIPPDKRPKKKKPPAYVKPPGISQRLAISTLKKIWHQYTIYGNISIIVGHFSQIHKRFNFITNNRQGACNCAIACLFAYLYKMEDWDRFYLDRILDHGDQLFFKSLQQPDDTCLTDIPPEKIITSFFFERTKVTLSLDEGPRVTEKLAEVTEQKAKEIFKNAIESFFKSYPSGIFAMLEKYLAIWIKDDSYYMFDPTPHDEYGQRWYGVPGCGCGEVFSGFSLLCRCKVLEDLVETVYNNVSAKPNTKFEIIECTVQRIVKINVVPPCCFEEYMVQEKPPEPEEEEVEEPPVDILEERLRAYIEEEKEEVGSMKVKIEEISPEVTDGLSVSKRPSWLQDTVDKGDLCKYGLPIKPNPEKVTFYLELLPERMFILRASTCQTDPNFSKYQGRQSMGNAISAIIMLRFYKSKVWVPRIVNTILKYGDLLYRDAMISIPRTQSLKLSNFQRKTEMEGKKFSPVIEDYVVVGRLQSKDYDVLDLEPALENYLLDQECCVLIGPITLAVWYEEKRYYWFDPNERDKNGKFIRKTAKINGNDVPLDYAPGVACVMWFANLKDLVDLYMYNVEKAKKWDPFYISKVQINDYIEIPDPWYSFKGLIPGKWILRGTICQWSKTFSRDSRNYQSPAIALIALALQILKPEKEWETETIDEILALGDQLYNASLQFLTENDKLVNKMLMLSEVNKIFVMSDKEANFEIDDCLINGIINAKNENDLKNLKMGLEDFFIDNDTAVVTSHNISVAVWKKDDIFYCYDAHCRDDKGIATGYGTACVLRTLDIDELASSVEMNLSPGKEDFYNINRVKIKFYETGDGVVRPPLNFYTSVNEDVAILRSLYSEITTKYDLNCRKQTIPMCLVALSFNILKPSTEWTKPDLDEILNKGDNLYVQSMLKIQKEEEEEGDANEEAPPAVEGEEAEPEEDGIVNSANVKTEFILGLNKINVEFEEAGEGTINENLKDSLRTFFEQEQTEDYFNQEALLESKPLSVAIWRDDKVFYVFDSKPRDKNGLTIGMEDWSEPEPPPPQEEEEEEMEGEDETPATEGEPENKDEEEFMGEEFPDAEAAKLIEPPKEEVNYDEPFDMNEGMEQGEEEGVKEEEEIVIPIIHKSSSYWREQEKKGKACTMWFTKLDDLIDHIYGNIAPKLKVDEPFALKSVKIINTAQLTDKLKPEDERNDVYAGDWYYFEEIIHGKWILRGTMNLMDKLFPEDNRGRQLLPASIVALAVPYIFSMICYNQFSVDTILSYGDKLFTFMKRMRRKQLMSNQELKLKEDEIDWLLLHETFDINDVVRRICLSKFIVTLEIEPEAIAGDINAQNFEDILDVRRGLEEFFAENHYGVLQCKDLIVAIWRGEKTYYMFDGMNRGPNGIVSPNGVACITRYLDIPQMAEVFLANLPTFGKNTFQIHKITMSKDICPREREPKELKEKVTKKVDTGGFHNVIPGKCIVRGTINQENPKFAKEPNVLSAPIAVIALTMTLIHKADTWSRPIVDDIIEWGAELYDESMHEVGFDFNPWDEKLDVYRVKNDYKVGVLKANCELRHMDQRGIINTKDEYILNLRQGIEKFFEENTHGIVVTDPLVLAIWEEQVENSEPLIYMFDPNPRGPSGMPLNLGTACVMTFVNAKVASDHIIGCILDPVQKMGEFTIVPVEIVVGNARTIRKLKRTQTRSEFVLSRCSKLVANEEKRALRKIAENERKRKEAKRLALIGRNGYYAMKGGEAIVRGYRSQNSDHYSPESRNNQDIANCIVSVVMHSLFSVDNWISKHVDLILDTGDQLYIDSYIAYGPKDKKLGLENILRKFFLKKLEIHVTVYKQIISDIFNVSSINRILDVYFQQEAYCMLCYYDQWVTIFFKSGYFYVFDPHERDIEGNVVKNEEKGTAIVSRFDDLGVLTLKLVQNLYVDTKEEEEKEFSLWLLSVENK